MSRYSELIVSQGANHFWSFDESGAPFYDSIGTIHCDVVNGFTANEISVVKTGVKSSSSSSLIRQSSVEGTLQFDNTKGFSYSVITRQDSYSTNNGIVGRRLTGTTVRTFSMFVFSAGTGTGLTTDIGANQLRWSTNFYPPLGEWCHLAYTYDPTTITGRIYYNGELLATNNYGTPPNNSSGDTYVMFGALQNSSGGGGSSNLAGAIDDVAIFQDKTLSAAEIRAQYSTAFPIMRIFNGTEWKDADRRII